jgi:hypothetical protein
MPSVKAVLLLILLALPLRAAEDPRPLSEQERIAVAIVARYLADGRDALWNDLAPTSPFRALPREEALRELATRLGPRERATWTLHTSATDDIAFRVRWPSGYEDALAFRIREGKLESVRSLAEATSRPASPAPAPPKRESVAWLGASVFFIVLAFFFRSRLRLVPIALAAGSLVAGGAMLRLDRAPAKTPARAITVAELRALQPLREALANGRPATLPQNVSAEARQVAALWLLRAGEEAPLGDATGPLAELIRARVALESRDVRAAKAALDRAVLVQRDDLLREAAATLPNDDGMQYVQRMIEIGSRDADAWYTVAARERDLPRAEQLFRMAWQLRPVTREALARDAALLRIVEQRNLALLVGFNAAEEPVAAPRGRKAALALPAGARAFVSGELLRVDLGTAALEIPNGAMHAPATAQSVAATRWSEERDAAAMREAAALLEEKNPPLSPRLEIAVDALAHHNRWRDVLTLTEAITPATAEAPGSLLVYRMIALVREKRVGDARALANGKAIRARMARGGDAPTLVPLAETLASIGEYTTAIAMYHAVQSDQTRELARQRIRELELRHSLTTTFQTLATAHFDVRYAPTINPAIASRIGDLLEAELARLLARFPPMEFRRTAVNVLHWDTFQRDVTGSEHIIGIYDGEITLPFADVQRFNVDIVATITHELTHAIVAQATGDNAPRWFQEGLAQRMELVRDQSNAFSSGRPEEVVPLPLLDTVLENATDPEAIRGAYATALTSIYFLEDHFGPDAPMRLVQAFARGSNTDDALVATLKADATALDPRFREWGATHSMSFATNEKFPYHHWYSPDIDPRIRAGIRFSRRPAPKP